MKKLLGISLVAVLAASPFAARAEGPVAGDPTHAESPEVTLAEPGYALVDSAETDSNAASAGYVKGAYNSAIKAINKVNSNINATIGSEDLTTTAKTLKGAINEVKSGGNDAIARLDATVTQAAGTDGLAISVTQTDGVIKAVSGSIAPNTYDAYGAATAAVEALDGTTSQSAGADGLAISVTQTDGAITAVSGSIAANTYDAYGAASTAESNANSYTDQKVAGLTIGDYAKKTGVVKTIQDTTIDVTDNRTITSGLTNANTATATTTITIMNDWSNPDSSSTSTAVATTALDLSGVGVSSTLTGSAPTAAINDSSVVYDEPAG